MIQISPQMRILACTKPVDFRKGIDGLAHICRQVLEADPFSGTVFVFCNRRKTALKLLCYDGQGFWLCQKRLSSGALKPGLTSPRWMPTSCRPCSGTSKSPRAPCSFSKNCRANLLLLTFRCFLCYEGSP